MEGQTSGNEEFNVVIGASQVDGTTGTFGSLVCAQTYDAAYAELDADCL